MSSVWFWWKPGPSPVSPDKVRRLCDTVCSLLLCLWVRGRLHHINSAVFGSERPFVTNPCRPAPGRSLITPHSDPGPPSKPSPTPESDPRVRVCPRSRIKVPLKSGSDWVWQRSMVSRPKSKDWTLCAVSAAGVIITCKNKRALFWSSYSLVLIKSGFLLLIKTWVTLGFSAGFSDLNWFIPGSVPVQTSSVWSFRLYFTLILNLA